jgi:PAS domain-containing protein
MPKRLNASLSGSVLTADRSMPASPLVEMMQLLDGGAFGAVFESSGEALIVMDSLGTIHRVNSRSKEMLRYTEAGERQKKTG